MTRPEVSTSGSTPELMRSLVDGYGRYDLSIAGLEAFRQLLDDSDRDPWPSAVLAFAVAQAISARRAGGRGDAQNEAIAWADAAVSAVGSTVALLRLDPGRAGDALAVKYVEVAARYRALPSPA